MEEKTRTVDKKSEIDTFRPGFIDSFSSCLHLPAKLVEQSTKSIKQAPAPTPQEQAESDQEGHLARVKPKGAAGEQKKKWRLAHLNNL